MNFVQLEFIGFMALVFGLYWSRSDRGWQNGVLLVASAVFYGWVHPWFLILLYGSALLDFNVGRWLVRAPAYRHGWLALSVCGNVGLLLFFKYFDFFVVNVGTAFESVGMPLHMHTLGLLLPVGISFYTFQTMSYTIDIYRGELQPRRSFFDYLVFISFFPQLVAGPIERAVNLLPQLEKPRVLVWDRVRSGFGLAMWGAFKKVVIADTIAPYVDKAFVLEEPAGPLIWMAALGFMIQLYADFSGYTDIARGTARMLGVDLVKNFNEPWFARTTQEFWNRWHMSMTHWVRDYLLAPLLGDVKHISMLRFGAALIVTMTVIGAWHGAGWNFILFGLFHAMWMLIYAAITRNLPAWAKRVPGGNAMAIVFHLVAVGWVGCLIFRESSLTRLVGHFSRSPLVADPDEWVATLTLVGVVLLFTSPLVLEHYVRRYVVPRIEGSPWYLPAQTTTWAGFAVAMFVFFRVSAYDFIYFQF